MSYIAKNLVNDENILYQTKLHWAIFLSSAILFGLSVYFFIREASEAGGFFFLIAMASGISSFINYKTSEFGITNKRVIVKVGFIRRNSVEVLLNKVEGIQVNQGILGRILGFGSITVSGTGGTKNPFHKIDAPLEFRRKVQEQIAAVQDSK